MYLPPAMLMWMRVPRGRFLGSSAKAIRLERILQLGSLLILQQRLIQNPVHRAHSSETGISNWFLLIFPVGYHMMIFTNHNSKPSSVNGDIMKEGKKNPGEATYT